ncbi:MAG: hypothetical protein ACPGQL_09455 [Thermoplasmatota archaeon]
MATAVRTGIWWGVRLALAHHPLCGAFPHDVLRRVPVCSGCAFTWPAFFLTVPVAAWALRAGAPATWLFAVGLLLGAGHGLSYLVRMGVAARRAAKGVGGAGLAGFLVGGLALPVPLAWRVAGVVALLAAFVLLQVVRLLQIRRRCHACPYQADWGRCPGFDPTAAPLPPDVATAVARAGGDQV